MTLRTRARGRAVMTPHDDEVESLAAQSRLALVRPGRPPLSVADLFQSKAVLNARLTRPSAQQRTWGIATISAGKCRRFGHRNLKRITMERIMTVKAWTCEDGITPRRPRCRTPVSTRFTHLTVRLSTLERSFRPLAEWHPHLSPRIK